MIRRTLRIGFRLGFLATVGFAVFKLVQSRRSATPGMPSGDSTIVPNRPNQPLVDPSMLHGLDLHKADGDLDDEAHNGQVPEEPATSASADTVEASVPPAPVAAPTPAPAPPAAVDPVPAPDAAPSGPSTAAAAAARRPAAKTWVDPKGAFCPSSHPVKAKLSSGIFHLPGMTAYERTTPDRCYADQGAAEADGLRKAKR